MQQCRFHAKSPACILRENAIVFREITLVNSDDYLIITRRIICTFSSYFVYIQT